MCVAPWKSFKRGFDRELIFLSHCVWLFLLQTKLIPRLTCSRSSSALGHFLPSHTHYILPAVRSDTKDHIHEEVRVQEDGWLICETDPWGDGQPDPPNISLFYSHRSWIQHCCHSNMTNHVSAGNRHRNSMERSFNYLKYFCRLTSFSQNTV